MKLWNKLDNIFQGVDGELQWLLYLVLAFASVMCVLSLLSFLHRQVSHAKAKKAAEEKEAADWHEWYQREQRGLFAKQIDTRHLICDAEIEAKMWPIGARCQQDVDDHKREWAARACELRSELARLERNERQLREMVLAVYAGERHYFFSVNYDN